MNIEEYKNIVVDRWLSDILKRSVYKIAVDEDFVQNNSEEIIKELQSNNVFLYAKVPASSDSIKKFLEKLDFRLVDTNIILEKAISKEGHMRADAVVRFAKPNDEDSVVDLARRSFQFSRFHLDKNFSAEIANRIKAEWVKNYFKGNRGTNMTVALIGEGIKGFLLLIQDKSNTSIIDLIAVDSDYRNKAIASDMITFIQQNSEGIDRLKVGTQIANTPSLRLYEKLGFKITESYNVFHYHGY